MNPSWINLLLNVHISANCHVHAMDKGFSLPLSAGSSPCRVSHSRCPLIKLQPCSLLSCWQTKVLKRTPSVIASNLRHNVVFHVNWSEREKGAVVLSAFFSPLVLSHFHFEEHTLIVLLLCFVFNYEEEGDFYCDTVNIFVCSKWLRNSKTRNTAPLQMNKCLVLRLKQTAWNSDTFLW